jgi:hypothetical protein
MQEVGEIKKSIIEAIGKFENLIGAANARKLTDTVEKENNYANLFQYAQELKEVVASILLETDPEHPIDTSFEVRLPDGGIRQFKNFEEFKQYSTTLYPPHHHSADVSSRGKSS